MALQWLPKYELEVGQIISDLEKAYACMEKLEIEACGSYVSTALKNTEVLFDTRWDFPAERLLMQIRAIDEILHHSPCGDYKDTIVINLIANAITLIRNSTTVERDRQHYLPKGE